MNKIEEIVEVLGLLPHPEGGFFKETYRSDEVIPKEVLNGSFSGSRNCCTAIHFLLTATNFSAFHRIKQDELWHHYDGDSLYVHVIDADGVYKRHSVGMDLKSGERPQLLVAAGCWFASSIKQELGYSLVGCTVSPGFDFDDFELAQRDLLIKEYPEHKDIISEYTRV